MNEGNRIKQLLEEITDMEATFDIDEKMIWQNMKILHLGMQSKLYNIMLTWDFALAALNKGQCEDIVESLEDDHIFYERALNAWKNQNAIPNVSQSKQLIQSYTEWLIDMLHHEIVNAFHLSFSEENKEYLRRLICDYREKLKHIYIVI